MTDVDVAAVSVVVLDPAALSDDAVRRVAVGAAHVHLVGDGREDVARWTSVRDGIGVDEHGPAGGVANAIATATALGVPVVVCPPPRTQGAFVSDVVRAAVEAAAAGLPAVAVHVVRDAAVEGPVAWLSQTGARSGYGVLFAVGFAQLHGLDVVLVEPTVGAGDPRTPDALDDALELASATAVRLTTVSDPSPVARVLRDPFSVAVQPVLDVSAGAHAGEPGLDEGNAEAVVRLLEEFPGDVVVVLDGVRLGEATSHLAQWVSAAVLSVLTVGAAGVALAPAAGAVGGGAGVAASAPATAGGVVVTASGQNGTAHTGTLSVLNRTDGPVTLQLVATWNHSGNHPPQTLAGQTVTVAPGASRVQSFAVPRPAEVHGQGGYHLGGYEVVVRDSHGNVVGTVPLHLGTQTTQTELGTHPVTTVVRVDETETVTTVTRPGGYEVVPPSTTQILVVVPEPTHEVTEQPHLQPGHPHSTLTPQWEVPGTQAPHQQPPLEQPPLAVPHQTQTPQVPVATPQGHVDQQTPIATPTLPTAQGPVTTPIAVPSTHVDQQTPIATPTLPPTQGPVTTPIAVPSTHVDQQTPIATPTLPPTQGPVSTPIATPQGHVHQQTPVAIPTLPQTPQTQVPPVTQPPTHPDVQVPPLTQGPQVVVTPGAETVVTPGGGERPVTEVVPPTTETQTTTSTQTRQTPQTPQTPDTHKPTDTKTKTDYGRPPTGTTDGGEQLAHTGAAQTGLLAGLAAALIAAGAGMVALGREQKPHDAEA